MTTAKAPSHAHLRSVMESRSRSTSEALAGLPAAISPAGLPPGMSPGQSPSLLGARGGGPMPALLLAAAPSSAALRSMESPPLPSPQSRVSAEALGSRRQSRASSFSSEAGRR